MHSLANPITEAEKEAPTRLAKSALIASAVAVIVGAIVARVGLASSAAAAVAQPAPNDIAPNGYTNAYNASVPGRSIADAGELTIFGGSLLACAAAGGYIGARANGWLGAAIGATLATVTLGLPVSAIATLVLSGDRGTVA